MKKGLMILGVSLFALAACKDDPVEPSTCTNEDQPTLKVSVHPKYDGNDLYLDSVYTTSQGYKVKFTDLKFYVENVKNGSNVLIDAGLFDFRERGTLLFSAQGKTSDYSALQANLGVGPDVNHNDPTAFSNSSWLNISNSNDMHWDWNPGYIFVKVEGKADTIPDATDLLNHNIVFHAGLDVNLQTLDFTNIQWVDLGNDQYEFNLDLDMGTFLQGSNPFDLANEYTSHSMVGQEAITLKIMQKFKEAITPQ